jgi:hypothetical protein
VKTPVLVLHRHPLGMLRGEGGWLLPLDQVEPYLVTQTFGGVDGLDPRVFRHVAVANIYQEPEARAVCEWLIEEYGVRHIVALHEKSILLAAQLRARYGLPGLQPAQALLFRDKVVMKSAVAAAGIPVPAYRPLRSADDLAELDWTRAYVIKPRLGVGSDQIHIVDRVAQARTVWSTLDTDPDRYEIEEFIAGDMYHCDAVVRGGTVTFAAVGRYHARPGAYAPGGAAGSYLVPGGDRHDRIIELNRRVIAALGMADGVTHLEVFHRPGDELVFLEIAARPGGGGIDAMIERQHGFSTVEAAIRLSIGLDPPSPVRSGDGSILGRLGFYPDRRRRPGISQARFAELGIVEHTHTDTAGIGDGTGPPRHCTDYVDRYLVAAADPDQFGDRIAAARAAYDGAPAGA